MQTAVLTMGERRRGIGERTAVYRFYDADGVLIYVGVTKNIYQRWDQHSHNMLWWHQVVRAEVVWLDSRPDALFAERVVTLAVLRDSLTPMSEAEAIRRRRWAVYFACRIGWSKYQIATELDISPSDVVEIRVAVYKEGGDWLTASGLRMTALPKKPKVDEIIETAKHVGADR